VVEKEAETERRQAIILAEKNAEVARINNDARLKQKEGALDSGGCQMKSFWIASGRWLMPSTILLNRRRFA